MNRIDLEKHNVKSHFEVISAVTPLIILEQSSSDST